MATEIALAAFLGNPSASLQWGRRLMATEIRCIPKASDATADGFNGAVV